MDDINVEVVRQGDDVKVITENLEITHENVVDTRKEMTVAAKT